MTDSTPILSGKTDRRAVRTRSALIHAINGLLLSKRRPRDIKVADITAAAQVGRSTFYEHYASADAIFLDAARRPLGMLADALTGRVEPGTMLGLLEHFWENRQLGRDTFARLDGALGRILADLIEERLAGGTDKLLLPPRLAARQLAEVALAPIRGWIAAEAPCTPAAMADAIGRAAQAVLQALRASTAETT